jgi:hypothetical protein
MSISSPANETTGEPLLHAGQLSAPEQLADQHDRKDAHRPEGEGLVRLHELVNLLSVIDHFLRLRGATTAAHPPITPAQSVRRHGAERLAW